MTYAIICNFLIRTNEEHSYKLLLKLELKSEATCAWNKQNAAHYLVLEQVQA